MVLPVFIVLVDECCIKLELQQAPSSIFGLAHGARVENYDRYAADYLGRPMSMNNTTEPLSARTEEPSVT